MDGGRRSSSARYRDHRWQVRARVGRAEADDGHGERELHLKWRARGAASEPRHPGRLAPRCGVCCQHSAPLEKKRPVRGSKCAHAPAFCGVDSKGE